MNLCMKVKQSAAKASAWGAVSMGASLLEDNRAADYVKTAVANLRDCFDSPCHESFCAYLSVSYAFCMIGNRNAFLRYAAFAVLIRREVVPPDLGIEYVLSARHFPFATNVSHCLQSRRCDELYSDAGSQLYKWSAKTREVQIP
jgi:hypothetical protein